MMSAMTANTPAPASPSGDAEPPKSDSVLDKLIDRLPEKFSPRWLLAVLGLLLVAVVALAYVAGVALAAIGGAVGLTAIIGALRNNS
jgi:hypothetical protein